MKDKMISQVRDGYHFFLSYNKTTNLFRVHAYFSETNESSKFFSESANLSDAMEQVSLQICAFDTARMNEDEIRGEIFAGLHSEREGKMEEE